jgi:type I restriction enzyme R subunit
MLVREHISTYGVQEVTDLFEINEASIELIKQHKGGETTKVINLVKSIERLAEEQSNDPFLIAMAERARVVQENFENRQTSTAEALEELFNEIKRDQQRKQEQAEKGFDGLTFFVYRTLLDAKVTDAEEVCKKISTAFGEHPNWNHSEKDLREVRKRVTFAIYAAMDDLETVTHLVDALFTLLMKAYKA